MPSKCFSWDSSSVADQRKPACGSGHVTLERHLRVVQESDRVEATPEKAGLIPAHAHARAHAHGHAHFPRSPRALTDTAGPRPCQRALLGVGRVQGGRRSCRLFETYQIQDVNSLAIRHIDSNFVSTSLQMCTLARSHSHLSCVLVRVPRKNTT